MVNAILTMIVIISLFYGRMPLLLLALLCMGLGIALAMVGRQSNTHFFAIDVLAQTSRLNKWNPDLKFWMALVLMILCVASNTPMIGLFLMIAMLLTTVFGGGIKLRDYVHMMALPVSFLLLGGLALVFEITRVQTGVFSVQVFGFWLSITTQAQLRATLVIARALGGISCLYFLSLSTSVAEVIGVLGRLRCPNVLIELMFLIYRYLFVLLSMYHTMHDATKSRLGNINYIASLSVTGSLYASLLTRSYRQANQNFDAMESRCFDRGIRFFEQKKRIKATQIMTAACMITVASGLTLWLL